MSEKFICTNKNCRHHFYSTEDAPIIQCPICKHELLNTSKVITTDNFLFIETMFNNIQTLGKEETFKMIDKTYSNAITRIKVRKIYFETLKILHLEDKNEKI